MGSVIPVGTIVTCPKCGRQIARIARDLHSGDVLSADVFIGISQAIKALDPMTCQRCGEFYFNGVSLHTERGWGGYGYSV